jgi:hypothetical protein
MFVASTYFDMYFLVKINDKISTLRKMHQMASKKICILIYPSNPSLYVPSQGSCIYGNDLWIP